jgi:hypothetical protein
MLRLLIGGQAVDTDDFEYTAVDPGGFETLSVNLPAGTAPAPGAEVLVLDGLEVAWHGIVEEPGQHYAGARATAGVQAVGQGALLKRNPYSMIYMDRALSRFGGASRQRNLNDATAGYVESGSTQVRPDATTGQPALELAFSELDTNTATPRRNAIEAWYDAGAGNRIAELRADYETFDKAAGGMNSLVDGAGWTPVAFLSDDDLRSNSDSTGDLLASGTLDVGATGARRYAAVIFARETTSTTSGDWKLVLKNVRLIGDHGLATCTGTDGLDGLLPGDIAGDALRRSRAGFDVEVTGSLAYIAPHLVYPTPVFPEQVVDDMAKLLGWHWGVWEPATLGGRPRAILAPPPATATAVASRADFDSDLEIVEQLSRMHNAILATYQLPDGTSGQVTVTKPHPRLADGTVQTLVLDVGVVGTPAAAGTIAAYTLALDQGQSRAAGQGTLSGDVRTAGGSRRRAHLLRPGRDRLRIRDLTGTWSVLDDTAAIDTFRLRRTTVTVTNGQPRTRVELDDGGNLIETLQARLAAVGDRLGG